MSFNLGSIQNITNTLISENNIPIQSSISNDIMSGARTINRKFAPDIQDIKLLLIQSWDLIKNNTLLRAPFYKLLKIHLLFCFILYTLLACTFLSILGWGAFILVFLLLIAVWIPIVWFIATREQGKLSLMIYKTKNNESFDESVIDTEINRVKIRLREVTWASLLDRAIRLSLNGKGGILGIIFNLLIVTIREAFDLMYNYLIPAVVIEKRDSWSEYVENFKKLTQKIPATLVGVFGIDFSETGINWILNTLLFFVFCFGALVGAGVGYLQITMGWSLGAIVLSPHFAIHILPIILSIMCIHMFLGAKRIAFEMMKTMYFTVLYISLQSPDILEKEPNLKDYLTFGGKH